MRKTAKENILSNLRHIRVTHVAYSLPENYLYFFGLAKTLSFMGQFPLRGMHVAPLKLYLFINTLIYFQQ
jgi:hypothetical protein